MKNGEVLKKKRQQGGKVMKDSELRMIETMLKIQDELNSAIMKEFGLTTISKEQLMRLVNSLTNSKVTGAGGRNLRNQSTETKSWKSWQTSFTSS